MHKRRPKHLALWQIRLPVPGIVSILHRVSGVLLFIAFPFLLYLLQSSLLTQSIFEAHCAMISQPLVKITILLVLWSIFHHMCAGIRFLFLDIHQGVALRTARTTAKIVLIISLLLTVFVGAWIW